MQKTILITGATDGIGMETAKLLVSQGHYLLLHGRNPAKLETLKNTFATVSGDAQVGYYLADLSIMSDVEAFANSVADKHTKLDVLINNAGILKTPDPITADGLDVRFVVNTFAPYLLTQRLLPLLDSSARVVNLSSAAQSPVDLNALKGKTRISDDLAAYAQSKLAITMWSRQMALELKDNGPIFVAVNPGSLLGTKMVKEGFGMDGKSIRIGADILIRAALSEEFENASGMYFDNDAGQFSSPHPDALDAKKTKEIVRLIESVLSETTQ